MTFDDLSNRSKNALAKAGIHSIPELLELSEQQLWNLPNMGAKSVKEVLEFRQNLDLSDAEKMSLISDEDSILARVYGIKDISISDIEYKYDGRPCDEVKVDELPFGVRVTNVLDRESITTLGEICERPYADFLNMENLGGKSLDEILDVVKTSTRMPGADMDSGNPDASESDQVKWRPSSTLLSLAYNRYGIKPEDVDYVRDNMLCLEISTDELSIPFKLKGILDSAGVMNITSLCRVTLGQFKAQPGAGDKSVSDAIECIKSYTRLRDKTDTSDDESSEKKERIKYARKTILAYLDRYGSLGAGKLREYCKDNDISYYEEALLSMIEDNDIKYSEERYFVTYPTFEEFIAQMSDSREKDVLFKRASGKTLEGIGEEYGLTRERVRQIISKQLKKFPHLSEDRFVEVFSKYEFNEVSATKIFGISSLGYGYLVMKSKMGEADLSGILEEDIPVPVKKRAEEYIYRDYIDVDGIKIKRNRYDILMYVCRTYCVESKSQDEIMTFYQDFLKQYHLEENPDFEYTDRYFEVTLTKDTHILSSYKKRHRYHSEFSAKEVSDLLSDIHFWDLNDIEVSTNIFFTEYFNFSR